MSGFGRTSAPVAICGVLRFLEALGSYKFEYKRFFSYGSTGWLPSYSHLLFLETERDSDFGRQLPLMLIVSHQIKCVC